MGRGLSDLQRWILREGTRRERVYYADILAGFFKFRPLDGIQHEDGKFTTRSGQVVGLGSPKFCPDEIGRSAYRTALAVISRSCARLADRGLVTCLQGRYSRWAAVTLTDEGVAWVRNNLITDVATFDADVAAMRHAAAEEEAARTKAMVGLRTM
jgi:hypothetical protein